MLEVCLALFIAVIVLIALSIIRDGRPSRDWIRRVRQLDALREQQRQEERDSERND